MDEDNARPVLAPLIFAPQILEAMPQDRPHQLPHAKFPTGQLFVTPNALRELGMEEMVNALGRHIRGDWGEVDEHDSQANDVALVVGSRLFSVYSSMNGIKFWIITEADRSYTTILLPEDY